MTALDTLVRKSASHPLRKMGRPHMDGRVKPGHDASDTHAPDAPRAYPSGKPT
jgi:hypothetical protein